jgi:hypothetical protein
MKSGHVSTLKRERHGGRTLKREQRTGPASMIRAGTCVAVFLFSGFSGAEGDHLAAGLCALKPAALRDAVQDLAATFGGAYPDAERYLAALDEKRIAVLIERLEKNEPGAERAVRQTLDTAREAMLANPLLDFDELLVIQRSEKHLGLVKNWESNSSLPRTGIENTLMLLKDPAGEAALTPLYQPPAGRFLGDVDLDFDAARLLFSMPDETGRFRVWEYDFAGNAPAPLPLIPDHDVDNYDACYLPGGDVIFCSTAPFVGVPCVTGASHVCHLYRWRRETGGIRRLTFEQDHNWCPEVLENGRILYLRWEYSDIPHFASRILFHMNPDGTNQMAFYGSNSYWPNALFYARGIPGRPSQFIAVVGGHHDVPRMGELVLFDTARGRFEADGVIQRIPGRDEKVEPVLLDGLVGASWPKFLHPWPLSEKYFLAAVKPDPDGSWGIYLADVFDNLTLVKEVPGHALFEPVPLCARPEPPVIPDRVDTTRKDALVYMTDIYQGPGLAGVPRGTVKALRLFTYHFAYHGMGGQINRVGLDGPWDIKRMLGTVPVEEDGSALFRVPANTPIAAQPLDNRGRALQRMRSWFTAMPGEALSCVGCHESQSMGPPPDFNLAARAEPAEITPFYGPERGFSFVREVQPVLDAHCVVCHNGETESAEPDLSPRPPVHPPAPADAYRNGTQFTPAYLALRRYVRVPTMESDMHLLPAGAYHAVISPLIQMLAAGHYGVQLEPEARDRLITWIDLHAPAHGTWTEIVGEEKVNQQRDRRRDLLRRYAGIDKDPEKIYPVTCITPQNPAARPARASDHPDRGDQPGQTVPPEPVDIPEPETLTLDLAGGVSLDLVRIPAGVLDLPGGGRIAVEKDFWIGRTEITNRQYACFDPEHDSRLETGDFLQFSIEERGWPLNKPEQPVVRVSWREARAFCRWLSGKTGMRCDLPDAAQWEYACRAGAATPMYYGETEADFAAFANLADAKYRSVATYKPWSLPSGAIHPWRPAAEHADDGHRVSAPAASYTPNRYGLYDMHGNVREWTRGSAVLTGAGFEIAGYALYGGSWSSRPANASAASRVVYPEWMGVYDGGFRVMAELENGGP